MVFKNVLTIIKKIIGTAILIAVIWYLVDIIIEGKYLPFLGQFGKLLLDKFLDLVNALKSWLVK